MFTRLETVLKETFGYSGFRCKEQERAAKEIFEGKRDVFVSMPTGAGKHNYYYYYYGK